MIEKEDEAVVETEVKRLRNYGGIIGSSWNAIKAFGRHGLTRIGNRRPVLQFYSLNPRPGDGSVKL